MGDSRPRVSVIALSPKWRYTSPALLSFVFHGNSGLNEFMVLSKDLGNLIALNAFETTETMTTSGDDRICESVDRRFRPRPLRCRIFVGFVDLESDRFVRACTPAKDEECRRPTLRRNGTCRRACLSQLSAS